MHILYHVIGGLPTKTGCTAGDKQGGLYCCQAMIANINIILCHSYYCYSTTKTLLKNTDCIGQLFVQFYAEVKKAKETDRKILLAKNL